LILTGGVNFNIPRVEQKISATLTFTKGASDASNPTVDPIDLSFEGKGNVQFKSDDSGQKFDRTNKTFTTYGTVEEPDKLAPIKVLLTYHGNSNTGLITTDIIESPKAKDQIVKIGENSTYLSNVECSMTADQTDWSLLTFEGDMTGFNGIASDANKHMVFTVHGEIKADQSGFKAEGIETGFGELNILYQNGRLLGSLTFEQVPLGSATVTGVANILMDSGGWAFYANCMAENVPAPDLTTVKMGILIGNYPSGISADMKTTALKYSVNKEMPETFSNGLKGFFMVGSRDLPFSGLDIGIDVIVASAYVYIPFAAVDASFYGNFANGENVIGMGLYGKVKIEFGLEAITCTELSGYAVATAQADGTYINGNLNFSGRAVSSSEIA
jgi:hypothetical protein